jgi:hypothetical protein
MSTLERDGYAVDRVLLSRSEVLWLREELARLTSPEDRRGGVRSLGLRSEAVRRLAAEGLPAALAKEILGKGARPVKITAFDKTPRANWKVPWHQDLTIAVQEKREAEGFGPWSLKEGIHHVQPPAGILSRMLAVRVHLDETPEENGALRVVPGSHRLGRISLSDVPAWRRRLGEAVCPVAEGGAMMMRPLLLHASSSSRAGEHRRVIHIEYAGFDLPLGLRWPGLNALLRPEPQDSGPST